MAKPLLTITKNFDFSKLEQSIDKILSKGTRRVARSAAKGAKERIERGLRPPLKKSTIELRKARGTGGTKPLYETGALHRSIKPTENGLEMLQYGLYHHKGFTAKNVPINKRKDGSPVFLRGRKIQANVPARPFIFPSQKEILDPMKKIYMDMRDALTVPIKKIK